LFKTKGNLRHLTTFQKKPFKSGYQSKLVLGWRRTTTQRFVFWKFAKTL